MSLRPVSWQPRRQGLETLWSMGYGLPLIPLAAGTKVPIAGFNLKKLLRGEMKPEETAPYFEKDDSLNYGIPCLDGLIAIDFDSLERFEAFFSQYEKLAAETMVVRSVHGGCHVWFKTSEPTRRLIEITENVDLLGLGGYAVGPGSIINHSLCDRGKSDCPHSGIGRYEVVNSHHIMSAEALTQGASITDALVKRVLALGWKASTRAWPRVRDIGEGVPEGSRNNAAFVMAKHLLDTMKLAECDALFALRAWNDLNKPPLPEVELTRVLESARKYRSGTNSGRQSESYSHLWEAIRK